MSKTGVVLSALGFVVIGGAAAACPTFANVGNEAYDVVGALEPTGFPVVAGGNNNAQFCGGILPVNAPGIYGFFISPPDFSFFLSGAPQGTVVVYTDSPDPNCDTVLLTNTPTTDWYFNDDTSQLQSRIEMTNVPEGRLDVWVGTFDGTFCQTNLVMEVIGGAAAPADDGAKPDELPADTPPAAPAAEAEAPAVAEEAVEEAPALPEAPLPSGTEEPAAEDADAESEAPAPAETGTVAPADDSAAPLSK